MADDHTYRSSLGTRYPKHVVILLDATSAEESIRHRTITLAQPTWTMQIGRGSQSESYLEPASKNAMFSSRVMSRFHAVMKADPVAKKITIQDLNSMHGTYLGKKKLEKYQETVVPQGSTIMLGLDVVRGEFTHKALELQVRYQWSDEYTHTHTSPYEPLSSRYRNSFSVEYSEEDCDSDDDIQIIGESVCCPQKDDNDSSALLSDQEYEPDSSFGSEIEYRKHDHSAPSSPVEEKEPEKKAQITTRTSVSTEKEAAHSRSDDRTGIVQLIEVEHSVNPVDDDDSSYPFRAERVEEYYADSMDSSSEESDENFDQIDSPLSVSEETKETIQPTTYSDGPSAKPTGGNFVMPNVPAPESAIPRDPRPNLYNPNHVRLPSFEATYGSGSLDRGPCFAPDTYWNSAGWTERPYWQLPPPPEFPSAYGCGPFATQSVTTPYISKSTEVRPPWCNDLTGHPELNPYSRAKVDIPDVLDRASAGEKEINKLKRKADEISKLSGKEEQQPFACEVEITTVAGTAPEQSEQLSEAVSEQTTQLLTPAFTPESENIVEAIEVDVEPPRKKIDRGIRPRQSKTLARYAATAIGGAAFGAVATIGLLVSLPQEYFG